MQEKNIEAAAARLREAARTGIPCLPIRDLIGETDVESAYHAQSINNVYRMANGARPIGVKIGLTSPAVQKQLGVAQPDFGFLWNDREVWNGGEISVQALMQPKAEAEIAFVLGKSLLSPNPSTMEVMSAIDHALASIEIVGSRIAAWDIRITDTIADNASASHWVVGHKPVPLATLDVVNCKMVLEKNGKPASEGIGAACLGSPINALCWLAKTMARLGKPLQAGDLILTGALGPMVPVEAGDHFRATIEGLGEVSVKFTP